MPDPVSSPKSPEEQHLRQQLGIPDDAKRVVIFPESSHWDPNWLYTAEYYYERFVKRNLALAIAALLDQPRRVYSVECIFFLRMFWDRSPEYRKNIRALVNDGRLRLTSTGVTTADTLLPRTEAILRDLLIGQEWLRTNGMTPEPRVAYFADSFGCTPALPSILQAAGFDRTAITRVDGMYFPGCDLEFPGRFPKPGSSAEMLLKREKTLDFLWRDRAGAEVLCHWNAFTYGHGDMLAHTGITRIYLAKLAVPMRTDSHIAGRIGRYVTQLAPYSLTPYMLCPIGFDFVEPLPNLVALLDRYNRNHYPATGVWAVNAGLDDYLTLVEEYRDRLPVIELDPNPYWTGFYTARPTLKRRGRMLVDNLLLAEKLACHPDNRGAEKTISGDLEKAWWYAAVSNHHDYITGTSPDSVAEVEQIPWLDGALETVGEVTGKLAPVPPGFAAPAATGATSPSPICKRKNGAIEIETRYYRLELDENAGGTIKDLRLPHANGPLLTSISNELVDYRDSGGLWRMGCEFTGGVWKESVRSGTRPAQLRIDEDNTCVEIHYEIELHGKIFHHTLRFDSTTPLITCRVEGIAAEGHSITLRFASSISTDTITMDTPGGVTTRPPRRIYSPTFWPLHRFAHLQDDNTGHGLAVLQPMPGAVTFCPEGGFELIAMRNASRETAFGLIKLPANPATGHERESYAFEYALLLTEKGDWNENRLDRLAEVLLHSSSVNSAGADLYDLAGTVITTDAPEVEITAVKPAARGAGIIVRLETLALPDTVVRVSTHRFKVTRAFLCDARERDLHPIDVEDGTVLVRLTGTVTTIRLLATLPGSTAGRTRPLPE